MDTKEKLLEAGARLFSENGFDAVSVRDIVSAAGANLGAVTYHFKTKEMFFEAIMERKIMPLRAIIEDTVKSDESPDVKIRNMTTEFALYVLHKDPGIRIFFTELISGGRRLPDFAKEGMNWRNQIFAEMIREGQKKGVFKDCDVECVTWSFFGMLSNYILHRPIVGGDGKDGSYSKDTVERIVDAALDMFFNGVIKPGEVS